MWIVSISAIFAVVLLYHPFMQTIDNQTTNFQNSFYLATFRHVFAFGVGLMIYACFNGTGGIIRWFLSHPLWKPIGRMGLSIYLVHIIYQFTILLNNQDSVHFSEFSIVRNIFLKNLKINFYFLTVTLFHGWRVCWNCPWCGTLFVHRIAYQ